MKVTRAGYYAWRNRSISAHEQRDCELARQILEIHEQSRGTYGSPRVFAMLKRRGVSVSRKRVERLMREYGIKGVSRSRKRVSKRNIVEREDESRDLVKRDFRADAPNQLWFADVTYVKTYEGWLYLAVVFDIYSRMIVGWSMAANMTAELVDNALQMGVVRRRPVPGLVHYSDHGSQYKSLLLGRTMRRFGIIPSMGSISSPWDNAVTESLMSTIKTECVHRQAFKTRDDARLEIFDYIEVFYNRLRIHSALGNLSPMEFEDIMQQQAVPA
jgi:transposase InsO family protein